MGVERCSDESLYRHMVEALGGEEDLAGRASNDFAKRAHEPANCGGIAAGEPNEMDTRRREPGH
jgi:hypothetical protein